MCIILCFLFCIFSQNTYTNAEKLLAAAEELARSGECDPEEVLSVARELEVHVAAFAARVDRRRRRLDLAVLLYTHEKEVNCNKLQYHNYFYIYILMPVLYMCTYLAACISIQSLCRILRIENIKLDKSVYFPYQLPNIFSLNEIRS